MSEQQNKDEDHGRANDGGANRSGSPVQPSDPIEESDGKKETTTNRRKNRNLPRLGGRKTTDCLLLVFNGLLALFTLLLALFTYLLWDSTKKEIQLGRDNLISDKRAWVPADIGIAGPLTWESGGGSVPFRFTLRNTGHTPALNNDHCKIVPISRRLRPESTGTLCGSARPSPL